MPNRRSPKKLEERIARQYVYKNSVSAHRNNDPNELRERIFIGSSDKVREAVLAEVKGERQGEIPEFERGLVISDSRGLGYFDINIL
jgi:hypothetical protein